MNLCFDLSVFWANGRPREVVYQPIINYLNRALRTLIIWLWIVLRRLPMLHTCYTFPLTAASVARSIKRIQWLRVVISMHILRAPLPYIRNILRGTTIFLKIINDWYPLWTVPWWYGSIVLYILNGLILNELWFLDLVFRTVVLFAAHIYSFELRNELTRVLLIIDQLGLKNIVRFVVSVYFRRVQKPIIGDVSSILDVEVIDRQLLVLTYLTGIPFAHHLIPIRISTFLHFKH